MPTQQTPLADEGHEMCLHTDTSEHMFKASVSEKCFKDCKGFFNVWSFIFFTIKYM